MKHFSLLALVLFWPCMTRAQAHHHPGTADTTSHPAEPPAREHGAMSHEGMHGMDMSGMDMSARLRAPHGSRKPLGTRVCTS